MSSSDLLSDLEREGDILVDRLGGQKPKVLKNRTDVTTELQEFPRRKAAYFLRAEVNRTFGRLDLGEEHLKKRRLARARVSDNGDEFTRLDAQRDVRDGGRFAAVVEFGDFVVINHGIASSC